MSFVKTEPAYKLMSLPGGEVIQLEVVSDPEDLKLGLKFRSTMPPGNGMLFVYPRDGFHSFTMYQTLIPLDMVWMDRDGVVVELVSEAQPDSYGLYGGRRVSSYGMELPAGSIRKYGFKIGQTMGGLDG
jgi:uncharacterized protein